MDNKSQFLSVVCAYIKQYIKVLLLFIVFAIFPGCLSIIILPIVIALGFWFDSGGSSSGPSGPVEPTDSWLEEQEKNKRVEEVRGYRSIGYSKEEAESKYTSKWGYGDGNKAVGDAYRDSDFCYIATASINGFMTLESIEPLKYWRYTVLEKSSVGFFFSNVYRRKAPGIAKKISTMPTACLIVRKAFVTPALQILEKRKGVVRDFTMWFLFLTLILTAKVITMFRK